MYITNIQIMEGTMSFLSIDRRPYEVLNANNYKHVMINQFFNYVDPDT